MNTYPSFPTCLDNETHTSDRINSKAQNHHLGIQSTFSQTCLTRLRDTHYSAFIEAAFSPAKYAIFQLLGNSFLRVCGSGRSTSTSSISAKIGCIGGTTLTILYLILLLARTEAKEADPYSDDSENRRKSLQLIADEVFYSAIASAIGAFVYRMNIQVDLLTHMLSGAIGPLLFLAVFFIIVGVGWCIALILKRYLDWYAGY